MSRKFRIEGAGSHCISRIRWKLQRSYDPYSWIWVGWIEREGKRCKGVWEGEKRREGRGNITWFRMHLQPLTYLLMHDAIINNLTRCTRRRQTSPPCRHMANSTRHYVSSLILTVLSPLCESMTLSTKPEVGLHTCTRHIAVWGGPSHGHR